MQGIQAIAVFQGKVKGTVRFHEDPISPRHVIITIDLEGLKKNHLHGFHVHERGDMSLACESMCGHFNPYGRRHGCPGMKERHVGDLGNLQTDAQGKVNYMMRDNVIQLRGNKANIIGRGLVIHAGTDDCGQGENEASSINGNAGKRIACAVIGLA